MVGAAHVCGTHLCQKLNFTQSFISLSTDLNSHWYYNQQSHPVVKYIGEIYNNQVNIVLLAISD